MQVHLQDPAAVEAYAALLRVCSKGSRAIPELLDTAVCFMRCAVLGAWHFRAWFDESSD